MAESAALKTDALGELEEGDVGEEVDEPELPAASVLGSFRLKAEISALEGGPFKEQYPNDGRALPKNFWLRFSIISTSVPQPYSIRWTVTNHGQEAILAHDVSHTKDPGGATQRERTRYRGRHTMTCELYRDGRVLARAHHRVNIR